MSRLVGQISNWPSPSGLELASGLQLLVGITLSRSLRGMCPLRYGGLRTSTLYIGGK
jgi:hypothetical protein